ncbi:MAG: hypothetical protein ACRCV9_06535, partial [Burkholderiaceae bacterium]
MTVKRFASMLSFSLSREVNIPSLPSDIGCAHSALRRCLNNTGGFLQKRITNIGEHRINKGGFHWLRMPLHLFPCAL